MGGGTDHRYQVKCVYDILVSWVWFSVFWRRSVHEEKMRRMGVKLLNRVDLALVGITLNR